MDIQSKQEQLNKIFEKNGVVLAYVFGSAAKGKENELSDLDIAVAFGRDVEKGDQNKRELDLSFEIGKLFEINRVDIANLNKIDNPLLLYNIVLEGKAVFINDQRLKIFLERRALREYEDTTYLRNISAKIMYRQIKAGNFGVSKI